MANALSMNLYYCDQCGVLVSRPGHEIPTNQWQEERVFCAACTTKKSGTIALPRKKDSARMAAMSAEPVHAAPTVATAPERRVRVAPKSGAAKAEQSPLIIAGISFVAVILLLGGWLVLGRKGGDTVAKNTATPPVVSTVKPPETRPTPPVTTPLTVTPTQPIPATTTTPTPQPLPIPNTNEKPPVPPPLTTPEDDYDPRKETSNLMLKQAKAWFEKNSGDVYGYKEKLQTLKDRYNGTPAANEAAQIIPTLKLPPVDPNTNPDLTPEADWANATQILQSVDPGKDRINSNWSYQNGVLKSDQSMWARIGFPYTLPDEYDLRLTFMRPPNGGDCLLIILARRGHPFIFSIGSGNRNCSFEDIREKAKDFFPTKTQRDMIFTNNNAQQIVIQVRNQCLRGYLNGKPIVGCQVDDDGLNLAKEMQLPTPNQLGLASWATEFQFTKLEVLPLKGAGKFLR